MVGVDYLERCHYFAIATSFRLETCICRIKPPRNQSCHVLDMCTLLAAFCGDAILLYNLDMLDKQLLRENATGRVNSQLDTFGLPFLQVWCHILEERRGVGARPIAIFPQVTLQVFQACYLDVSLCQVLYIGLECFWGCSNVLGEGIAVWLESGVIPSRCQNMRKCVDGVWKLIFVTIVLEHLEIGATDGRTELARVDLPAYLLQMLSGRWCPLERCEQENYLLRGLP